VIGIAVASVISFKGATLPVEFQSIDNFGIFAGAAMRTYHDRMSLPRIEDQACRRPSVEMLGMSLSRGSRRQGIGTR